MPDLTHPSVYALTALHLDGLTVPRPWLTAFQPDCLKALLLAELVAWFQPVARAVPETGADLGWGQRFPGDALQRHPDDLAALLGCSALAVRDRLLDLAERDLITLTFDQGVATISSLNAEALYRLTYPSPTAATARPSGAPVVVAHSRAEALPPPSEGVAMVYPYADRLDRWVRATCGVVGYPPGTPAHVMEAAEIAMRRLVQAAEARHESAESVLECRVAMKSERQQRLRDSGCAIAYLSHLIGYIVSDLAKDAAKEGPPVDTRAGTVFSVEGTVYNPHADPALEPYRRVDRETARIASLRRRIEHDPTISLEAAEAEIAACEARIVGIRAEIAAAKEATDGHA